MTRYEYRDTDESLGDQDDCWLVFKTEDDCESSAALCSTEYMASSVANLLNGLPANIAAIATNFAKSEAFSKAVDGNWGDNGWSGIMDRIVTYAQAFTEHETEPDTFDWYLAIDDYCDSIVALVLSQEGMSIPGACLTMFAKDAIRKHSYPA
jgi:hypothetical protein